MVRGDWAGTDTYARELIALGDQSDEPWWGRDGETILAQWDPLERRPEAAVARLEPVLLGTNISFYERSQTQPILAEAYTAMGRGADAEELLARFMSSAQSSPDAMYLLARHAQAKLLIHSQRWDEAQAILDNLLVLTRSMPEPLTEGNLLHDYARMHLARGEQSQARERWEASPGDFSPAGREALHPTHRGVARAIIVSTPPS
ncbi:MAG: tetratricopeptide repeat protein [Chloroflexota bacterium]|nr:MAG: hypothetical protein DLM70_10480 [Chloroflexota bacterium]